MEAWTSDLLNDEGSNPKFSSVTTFKCYETGSSSGTSDCELKSLFSLAQGHQGTQAFNAQAFGMGMANTNRIYDLFTTAGGKATGTYAAGVAWAFTNNGKTDWHLPSLGELRQMMKWQLGQAWSSDATNCTTGGTRNSATYGAGAMNFADDYYWTSSEHTTGLNTAERIKGSCERLTASKSSSNPTRVVRAFG
jgi:hypothetical protein